MTTEADGQDVVAPATAPAAEPAKGAPAPDTQEPTTQEPQAIEYAPTGDPGLDYALGFLAKAGIDADDPALVAASDGDFGLLEAILAQKGIPGWEQAVALGKQAQGRMQEKAKESQAAVEAAVLGVAEAHGVDWEEAVAWGKENAEPGEIEAINKLFADPATAKIAAHYLISNFASAPGVDVPPRQNAVKDEAVGSPAAAPAQGAIDRKQFAVEAGKLHKQFGDAYTQRPEYAALARRLQR